MCPASVLMGRYAYCFWCSGIVTDNIIDIFLINHVFFHPDATHSFLRPRPSGLQLSTDITVSHTTQSGRDLHCTESTLLALHHSKKKHKLSTLKMSSGLLAATSSISMPPCGLPTMTGPLQDRSIRMAKYVSLLISKASATITWTQQSRRERLMEDCRYISSFTSESHKSLLTVALIITPFHFSHLLSTTFTLHSIILHTIVHASEQGLFTSRI